jgi:DNA-binding transcriptional LysR family regulator
MVQTPLPLNKLLVLGAILDSGSVSGAARQLGRTQPSVSKTLNDLRAFYDNPLLVRDGGRLQPTSFARALLEGLTQWRLQGEALLAMRSGFDPGLSKRHFTIRASDYHHAVFGALIGGLAVSHHGTLSFDITRPVGTPEEDYPVSGFDFAFRVNARAAPAFEARRIFSEPYLVLFDPAHRPPPQDMAGFLHAPFVLAAPAGSGPSAIDRHLAGLGLKRRIAIRTHQMLDAGRLVAGTQFLSVLPASAAHTAAKGLGLKTAELLFKVPEVVTHLIWPRLRAADPAILWLAGKFAAAGETLGRGSETSG